MTWLIFFDGTTWNLDICPCLNTLVWIHPSHVLLIRMSKKAISLFFLISMVNCIFGWYGVETVQDFNRIIFITFNYWEDIIHVTYSIFRFSGRVRLSIFCIKISAAVPIKQPLTCWTVHLSNSKLSNSLSVTGNLIIIN